MGQHCIKPIQGVIAKPRRTVVFLEDDEDKEVNASSTFSCLDINMKRNLLSRVDLWMDGGRCDHYFHGWNEEDRKYCFVFKIRRGNVRHRFYGFLCHPSRSKPNFEVCALLYYTRKFQEATDSGIIRNLNHKRINSEVLSKLQEFFPDIPVRQEPQHENRKLGQRKKGKTLDRGKR
jgi:hypothetical protein